MVESRILDSNMDGFSSFSGNLFPVLVYYLEVRDVGSEVTILFLYYLMKGRSQFSSGQDNL